MKNLVLSVLAVAALAGTANAQARLELRLVRQSGNVTTPAGAGVTDVDINNVYSGAPGDVLRFELQYRVVDLDDTDDITPAGLSSGTINISTTTGTLTRAQLSRFEAQLAATTPPTSTDTSGLPTPAANSGRRGLHAPFRGGLADANNNDLPANGIVNVDTNADPNLYTPGPGNTLLSITPVSVSQNNQGNANNGIDNSGWYGLYSFNYTVGATNTFVVAAAIADPQTGNSYGYFNDGVAVPVTSQVSTGASYRIIVPAPGAAALVGLGGLLVARRRRA